MTKVTTSKPKTRNKKSVSIILATVLGMFCFSFALVPLYNSFCNLTGLNGKTGGRYTLIKPDAVDNTREVTLQFTTNLNRDLPWEFTSDVREVTLHPGELRRVNFYVKNNSDHTIVGRAIPSMTPGVSAPYLHKMECFCFTEQPLRAHETKVMPLVFFIDKALPKNLKVLTLSYTFFDTQKPPPAEELLELAKNSPAMAPVAAAN